jgi:hypothetical protein
MRDEQGEHDMPSTTEQRIQDCRELTAQELEAISGGWAGWYDYVTYARMVIAIEKAIARRPNTDDCGREGCN